MVRSNTAVVETPLTEQAGFGDRPPPGGEAPAVENAMLAVVLFIGTETMLFTAIVGVLAFFRASSLAWPPPGQPYLPAPITWANTGVLLASAFAMHAGVVALRANRLPALRRDLALACALGVTFLVVQGVEWVRLVRHGLTLTSGLYGTTFYSLIGLHGLHVFGAVCWLLAVVAGAWRGRYAADRRTGVEVCAVYWYFVCGLWIALYGLVYLS